MVKLTKNKEDNNIPLAIINGGKNSGDIVYFDNNNIKEGELKIDNLFDYISDKKVRQQKKYMTTKELLFIKDAFEKNNIRHEIKDIYDKLKPEIQTEYNKHVHIHDGQFEIIPMMKDNQVQKCFVSGMSGSGKSTWISKYAQNYKKLFPKNEIYVISRHTEDEVIDKLKPKRIKLDEEILDVDIDLKDLNNSLVIFDDIDTIPNKKINQLVSKLRDDLLENARHHNIYMCCVAHQILNYTKTRHLILESDTIVFFPRSGGYQIRRFLKEYIGLDKDKINMIMKINSRWICLNKQSYPISLISENDIYIL